MKKSEPKNQKSTEVLSAGTVVRSGTTFKVRNVDGRPVTFEIICVWGNSVKAICSELDKVLIFDLDKVDNAMRKGRA